MTLLQSDNFYSTDAIQGELFNVSLCVDQSRGYRGSVAMKVAGITYRQLDYWARKRIIEPSINPSKGSGSRRLYSFKDIAIMAVAKRLLDAGVNLVNVTTAIIFLNRYSKERLRNMTIICDGQSVQECDENQDNMRRMLASGVAVFAIAVGRIVSRVEDDLAAESFVEDSLDSSAGNSESDEIKKNVHKSSIKSNLLENKLSPQVKDSFAKNNSWNLVQETWG